MTSCQSNMMSFADSSSLTFDLSQQEVDFTLGNRMLNTMNFCWITEGSRWRLWLWIDWDVEENKIKNTTAAHRERGGEGERDITWTTCSCAQVASEFASECAVIDSLISLHVGGQRAGCASSFSGSEEADLSSPLHLVCAANSCHQHCETRNPLFVWSCTSLAGPRKHALRKEMRGELGWGRSLPNTRDGIEWCCAWRKENIGTVSGTPCYRRRAKTELGFANVVQTWYDLAFSCQETSWMTQEIEITWALWQSEQKYCSVERTWNVLLARKIFNYCLFMRKDPRGVLESFNRDDNNNNNNKRTLLVDTHSMTPCSTTLGNKKTNILSIALVACSSCCVLEEAAKKKICAFPWSHYTRWHVGTWVWWLVCLL